MSINLDEILGRATGVALTDNDVVFGRGGFTNKHPGNSSYLQLLSEHEEAYMNCQRKFQKLLSLCIIHQLRCKGVRFLKKNSKSGSWQTVQLSQCRLKISQRLRERAPFIKLEQMKATRGLVTKTVRRPAPAAVVKTLPSPKNDDFAPPLPALTITTCATAEVSSDEEEVSLLGMDDHSFQDDDDEDIIPLSAFEGLLDGNDSNDNDAQLEAHQEKQYEPIPTGTNKRSADSMRIWASTTGAEDEPQSKRIRTVSLDDKDYSTMLMRETSIISVVSWEAHHDDQHPFEEDINDQEASNFFQMEQSVGANPPTISKADSFSSDEEMFEYLQVLLC